MLSHLGSPYEIFFLIESFEFFLFDFDFEFGMHARPIRPHNLKELPNTFGLTL
jgi:hypothetical protein